MDFFKRLLAFIVAAAGVVTSVFGLFNSVLEKLAPPGSDTQTIISMVSMIALLLFLIIALALPKIPTRRLELGIAGVAAVALIGVGFVFHTHQTNLDTYVYLYPPGVMPGTDQLRLVAGEPHEQGKILIGRQTIAQTVFRHGGPDNVANHQLLWTQQSESAARQRLVIGYEVLVMLVTGLLFTLAILLMYRIGRGARRGAAAGRGN